jgi:hypothetical protein
MNETQFCCWLQGFFELSGESELTPLQVEIIKDHLSLVFKKETPNRISSNDLFYCSPSLKIQEDIDKEFKSRPLYSGGLKDDIGELKGPIYPGNPPDPYVGWFPVYREDVKDLGMEKYLPGVKCQFVYIRKEQLDPNIRNYPISC